MLPTYDDLLEALQQDPKTWEEQTKPAMLEAVQQCENNDELRAFMENVQDANAQMQKADHASMRLLDVYGQASQKIAGQGPSQAEAQAPQAINPSDASEQGYYQNVDEVREAAARQDPQTAEYLEENNYQTIPDASQQNPSDGQYQNFSSVTNPSDGQYQNFSSVTNPSDGQYQNFSGATGAQPSSDYDAPNSPFITGEELDRIEAQAQQQAEAQAQAQQQAEAQAQAQQQAAPQKQEQTAQAAGPSKHESKFKNLRELAKKAMKKIVPDKIQDRIREHKGPKR